MDLNAKEGSKCYVGTTIRAGKNHEVGGKPRDPRYEAWVEGYLVVLKRGNLHPSKKTKALHTACSTVTSGHLPWVTSTREYLDLDLVNLDIGIFTGTNNDTIGVITWVESRAQGPRYNPRGTWPRHSEPVLHALGRSTTSSCYIA